MLFFGYVFLGIFEGDCVGLGYFEYCLIVGVEICLIDDNGGSWIIMMDMDGSYLFIELVFGMYVIVEVMYFDFFYFNGDMFVGMVGGVVNGVIVGIDIIGGI